MVAGTGGSSSDGNIGIDSGGPPTAWNAQIDSIKAALDSKASVGTDGHLLPSALPSDVRGEKGATGATGQRGQLRAPTAISSRGMGRYLTTTTTDAVVASRTAHTFVEDATGIRLLVVGWGAGETSQPTDLTINAALEYAGVVTPFTWNGAGAVVVAPGAYALSDALGVNVLAGSSGWLRASRTAAGGAAILQTVALRASLGEGTASSVAAVTGASSGFTTVTTENTSSWAPLAILADSAPGKSVAIIGDSISNGLKLVAPEDGGYIKQSMGGNVGILRLNGMGGTIKEYIGNTNSINASRRRLALTQFASHAWVEYGVNDLNAGDSLDTIKANLMRIWRLLSGAGIQVWQSTITPWTTSTDAWLTTTNQNQFAGHATRIALNDWIRTVPAPLSGIFDAAAAVESGLNSGLWAVGSDGLALVADGVHPNEAGSAKIAAALAPVVAAALVAPNRYTGAGATTPAPSTPGMTTVYDEQIFSTAGAFTWTKPAGAQRVYLDCMGAASGGGSGRRGAATSLRSGGVGGNGPSRAFIELPASIFPATVDVTIPAGGAGGLAPTTSDTDGLQGEKPLGPTVFGFFITSDSSQNASPGGKVSTVAAGTVSTGMFGGGLGGQAVTGGTGRSPSATTSPSASAGGGGGGGGAGADNTAYTGGAGGSARCFPIPGGAPATADTPAGKGFTYGTAPGSGGGGGFGNAGPVNGRGGDGINGSGGGGGGASTNDGLAGGAGGKGSDGYLVVRTTCVVPAT